jgi:hypothetical protein
VDFARVGLADDAARARLSADSDEQRLVARTETRIEHVVKVTALGLRTLRD